MAYTRYILIFLLLLAGAGILLSCPGLSTEIVIENGRLVHNDIAIWGYGQSSSIWKHEGAPNITRNAPGQVGPTLTEDLDALTDAMVKYGYPGLEHSYGLWFDRRRDAHDRECRTDGNVLSPFMEQPWARSTRGRACDGLPLYDLSRYNDWYFSRLQEFARLSDEKGLVFYLQHYLQHALLESPAHYADFPWRPGNAIQDTVLPHRTPAANAFYDVTHAERRKLHRAYIRHTLDALAGFDNVFHAIGNEYTGNTDFVTFWIDTILEWEQEEPDRNVKISLAAPKNVIDDVLADKLREPHIDAIDLRYFWYRLNDELYAPNGGKEYPGRSFDGNKMAIKSGPAQVYRQTLEYHTLYPEKVIFHSLGIRLSMQLSFLMAGGSMNFYKLRYKDEQTPDGYVMPKKIGGYLPAYQFIRDIAGNSLVTMKVDSLLSDTEKGLFVLSNADTMLLYNIYPNAIDLDLTGRTGNFSAIWFGPDSRKRIPFEEILQGDRLHHIQPPSKDDWLLYIYRSNH